MILTDSLFLSAFHAYTFLFRTFEVTDEHCVKLDSATIIGTRTCSIDKFLGIAYAQRPVGDFGLRLPQALLHSQSTRPRSVTNASRNRSSFCPMHGPPPLLQSGRARGRGL
ncbi:hypothetical protein C8Q76DRAFT_216620 [Earliella scabrosa]|nr:hypothetical protein C8Q76DRAFT_216620 [Earliella scabrosa]